MVKLSAASLSQLLFCYWGLAVWYCLVGGEGKLIDEG